MTPLEIHLHRIRLAVEQISTATIEIYLEQLLLSSRANLRFRLGWPSGAVMEVSEALSLAGDSLEWLSYRYHFQSEAGTLRYDNAPHHPHLPTHPEHKHRNAEVIESWRPDLVDFLQEVRYFSTLW